MNGRLFIGAIEFYDLLSHIEAQIVRVRLKSGYPCQC